MDYERRQVYRGPEDYVDLPADVTTEQLTARLTALGLKLEAIGFGVFIPVFFAQIGINADLEAMFKPIGSSSVSSRGVDFSRSTNASWIPGATAIRSIPAHACPQLTNDPHSAPSTARSRSRARKC